MVFLDIDSGGLASGIGGLQAVLQNIYGKMLTHVGALVGIGQAIGGFGALWYIAVRIWRPLVRGTPIDVFSLLRPFAISIVIVLFPQLIGLINGVMEPTVAGTSALVKDSNKAIEVLLAQKQELLSQSKDWEMYTGVNGEGNLEKWEELSGEADSGILSGVSNRLKFEMAKASYGFKNSIKIWLSEILQVLYESAALCLNTIRTFYLIILAMFGPLVFGLSIYDGFDGLINQWLKRYLNVFLWLPVANIFGSLIAEIQQEMIRLDLSQLKETGQTVFGPTDAAYIIFLILAIAGYFTVPSVTNYIIQSGSHTIHTLGARLPKN